jgi:hypothetical protein
MEKTTNELTIEFIKEHPDIKNCLKKGLINYSSLSRYIAKELNIGNKTSIEAILIAARRFKDKLKNELENDKMVKKLFSDSEIEIKNKINVFIISKDSQIDYLDLLQKKIRKASGTFWLFEGTDNYTIITQDKYAAELENKLKNNIIKHHKKLSVIIFKTSKEIEELKGVVAYITSLFAENGVNIIEFFSCWNDTVFVIDSNSVSKVMDFLRF